jgi:hypothetical protein
VTAPGRCRWAIAAGFVPARGRGPEPEFTSRDRLCLLNAGEEAANVRVRVVYAAHDVVGPFRLVVAPRRVRHVRINDLIFPEAVRLEEPYGLDISSDEPVVVQFSRMDTRAPANAGLMTLAWGEPGAGR